ncbi:MAG TPA: XRE family transcriptional regulator [Bryobacteraceae bacterium]|nr:XRE family transcriptional regulator [Bryobacteraceae bacterium]
MDHKLQKSPSRSDAGRNDDTVLTFNPNRLSFARRRRGLKKADLARLSGVHIRSVTGFEAGEFSPSADTLERIAAALSFPPTFFIGDDIDEVILDSGSFRSMSKMTARQRDMALCQAAIGVTLGAWIERKFELPKPELPDLSREADPEAAAESLRQEWFIGALPIRNMVHLLESKGVRVFSLSIDAREVDAFSMWKAGTPYVFLNTNKSSERSRFDAAHELGHLVLHKEASPHGREAETQANRFASAFLMPRASVLANAPRFPVFDTLVKLKKIWAVSIGALAYRLHELRVISDWQYRGLAVEIAKRDRTKEPEGIPGRETSLVFPAVFRQLYEEGITRSNVAQMLSVYTQELEDLLLGLVMTSVEGRRPQGKNSGGAAELRRIK